MKHLGQCLVFCISLILFSGGCQLFENSPPTVSFRIQPEVGDTATVFYLDARDVSDNRTADWQLQVRWDFNSDGIWETDFSHVKENAWKYKQEGTYRITCECTDSRGCRSALTLPVRVQNPIRDSILTDSRDGKTYRTVFLFNRWWMAESLRYGQAIDSTATSKDNEIPEYYLNPAGTLSPFGGYYTWSEATNYERDTSRGICPEGWHLPRVEDHAGLEDFCELGYFTKKYLGIGGLFHINLERSGMYHVPSETWHRTGSYSEYWMTIPGRMKGFVSWLHFSFNDLPKIFYDADFYVPEWIGWNNDWGFFTYKKTAIPVRCVKDE